jgi:hypothetical protein
MMLLPSCTSSGGCSCLQTFVLFGVLEKFLGSLFLGLFSEQYSNAPPLQYSFDRPWSGTLGWLANTYFAIGMKND